MVSIVDIYKVIITAMLPYLELRGAIPYACHLGLPASLAYLVALIGNMIPVLPVMILIKPLSHSLDRLPLFHRFFKWLFDRCRRRQDKILKYGYWGLLIFVAIPLPMTGAWSGALIAFLLGMRKRYTFLAILAGVAIAGLIVLLPTYGLARLFGL
ncbi:MAG: small multi-drug export protein [Bacillota bacterium]